MFRYQFELSGCEWAEHELKHQAEEMRFELRCHKRGARCCVGGLPAQLTVRSAPETDTLFVSVLRKDTVLARSDDIEIGGITRRVGVRTVPLRAEGAGGVVCTVRLMWSVEEEDGSVFAWPVEDYVAIGQQPSTTALGVPSDLHYGGSVPMQQEEESKQVLSTHREKKVSQSSGGESQGDMWCVNTLQHTPEGFLDYYTTSTQVLKPPEAWSNLYTSLAPLLVANGSLPEQPQRKMGSKCVTSARYRSGAFTFSSQGKLSAIEEIRQQPTKAADISAEDLQHLVYVQKKNSLKWRTFSSAKRIDPTALTRAR
ncbi:hypothetical protein LSM04_005640 [Trypanosoma melophagium]|uniref:uncharacterized protein n=1 Tax=Trypanosoma melophagium TaxID=715481 RepID=UPI00351A1297|nr:hypothetical protein LSM04_005640 [Trypanosoma melophagium]